MRCKQTLQSGKNLHSIGKIVKNKRIFQKGYNNFDTKAYYLTRRHRGRGIGSAFLGLARFLLPLLQSGYKAVKSEAISAGKDILRDFKDKQIENIVKKRGQMAVSNLKTKAVDKIDSMMTGEGMKKSIKRRRSKKIGHIVKITKRRKTKLTKPIKNKIKIVRKKRKSKPRKKLNIKEIFG